MIRSSWLVGIAALAGAAVAEADSFGGIAANEKSYVVGSSRVCTPLVLDHAVARGTPACRTATTDEVAGLTARMPSPERGPKAALKATVKGSVLTVVAADGSAVATWTSPDPLVSVVDVWQSKTARLVLVELVTRRAGREVHDVVGLDRGLSSGVPDAPVEPVVTPPRPPVTPPVAADPALAKALAKARKTSGKAAVKAWTAVLALDVDSAEAHYRLAAAEAAAKKADAAIARLENLAASTRADAIEWLVEARTDKAFAALVGEPRFRAAVGFDRPAATTYERVMGLGGLWEQPIVPCDRPEMKLTFERSRKLTMVLRTACSGMRDRVTYRGTWDMSDDLVLIKLPKLDDGEDLAPCSLTPDHDEDVLHCQIDEDLSFDARPVRR